MKLARIITVGQITKTILFKTDLLHLEW